MDEESHMSLTSTTFGKHVTYFQVIMTAVNVISVYFNVIVCIMILFQRPEGVPKLLLDGLFMMRGSQWKQTRNIITPAFSAGKLKQVIVRSEFSNQQPHNTLHHSEIVQK